MTPPTHTSHAVSPGHPDLLAAIRHEIDQTGPIPFARFMELALYHPSFGYYMRHHGADDAERRIGWQGDYYTTSDVSAFFAKALAAQAREIDARLGEPDVFTIVEMGPGKGLLARDVLRACEADAPDFFARLQYVLIERSPVMRAAQAQHLAPWGGTGGVGLRRKPVSWLDDTGRLATRSVVGLVYSNELVDAFPVHRVRKQAGVVHEIYVRHDGERFIETLGDLSSLELRATIQRLEDSGLVLADGATAEFNVAALGWMREVARVLARGSVVTIDYGHTASDLYDPQRRDGTLLCYYHQTASDDPYTRVGLQDMTAHVDFTALATAGDEAGLRVTGFTNQMSFLMGWGIEQELARYEPGSAPFQSLVHLLKPEGMGRTFKLLFQHTGYEPGELTGLKYRPFFGEALSLPGARRG
ncbi:MAG TPA: SAM-dependent methyltransferase [Nitrospirales bacterium]|nr:SAM-dependent methyltransferase [Nitrospirales bacterium]